MIAGICLLIWAVGMVKKGMIKAFGYRLNAILEKSTRNRVFAAFSGMGVTTLLQSSNATALVVSSFAGQGLIKLAMALAFMLGANVGTTLVAQFVSLDLSWLMPLLLIAGVFVTAVYGKSTKGKNIGRILLGLGFLFMALEMIVSGPYALRESPIIKLLFEPLAEDPIFALILAAAITWLLHSSLAFVLLTMALVSANIVSTELGIVMIIGSNIGSGLAPVAITAKMGITTFRVTFGNLLMRLLFGFACLLFLDRLPELMASGILGDERAIVNFHTAFNVAMALFFLPIVPFIASITKKIIPNTLKDDDPATPQYLDMKLIDNPTAALACASREALRLGDMVLNMLKQSIKPFETNDKEQVKHIRDLDDTVDTLFSHIKKYLVRLSEDEFDKKHSDRFMEVFAFATNMEHIGDIVVKNVMELAEKKIHHQKSFSEEGFDEIKAMHKSVVSNLKSSCNAFVSGDVKAAKRLLKEKKSFRAAEMRTTKSHMERMREGKSDTLSTSSMHMDIIRDFKRINSHIAAVAYPILERAGEATPLDIKKKTKS